MISIKNVSKRYGASTVVNNVSLEVEQGSITVIVGTSGSGKSTLMRMINRLVSISDGQILVNGQDINQMSETDLRRGIGYAIQGHGLFPHRTVGQNIATVPKLLGWPKAKIEARVKELLAVFNLEPSKYADKYPHQLSGGQQQRVGVARALAAEPQILLMDEPFGALDPVIRGKAQEDLLHIQKQFGISVILVTHDMDEAFHLGDKIAVMNNGELLQYGTPEEILVKPADPFCVQLTGTSDRALKLLSLTSIGDLMQPVTDDVRVHMPASRSLREALSEMTWQGVNSLGVLNAQGALVGSVSLNDVLVAGQAR
ncbi:MAG: ABC transporter ATP-binding protein [Formosimonas sp.]